jgi:hypothetical protein
MVKSEIEGGYFMSDYSGDNYLMSELVEVHSIHGLNRIAKTEARHCTTICAGSGLRVFTNECRSLNGQLYSKAHIAATPALKAEADRLDREELEARERRRQEERDRRARLEAERQEEERRYWARRDREAAEARERRNREDQAVTRAAPRLSDIISTTMFDDLIRQQYRGNGLSREFFLEPMPIAEPLPIRGQEVSLMMIDDLPEISGDDDVDVAA